MYNSHMAMIYSNPLVTPHKCIVKHATKHEYFVYLFFTLTNGIRSGVYGLKVSECACSLTGHIPPLPSPEGYESRVPMELPSPGFIARSLEDLAFIRYVFFHVRAFVHA